MFQNLKTKTVPRQQRRKLVDLFRQVYRVKSNIDLYSKDVDPTKNNFAIKSQIHDSLSK